MSLRAEDISIVAEPTANPHVCRFTVDQPLNEEGGPVHCERREDAEGSALLEALYGVEDVSEVLVIGNAVTVAKGGTRPWQEVGREIGAAIRRAIVAGGPLLAERWFQSSPAEDGIRQKVEQIFASEINPAIADHGGHVRVVDVKGTTVYLAMGGGCQGCAASQATLRGGVESAIRRSVPEVTEIVDVTDHAAGTDPYYS